MIIINNDKQMLIDIMQNESMNILNNNELLSYLDIQSRFFSYSVGNTLLIKKQMPSATKIADKEFWLKLNINIDENAKPIKILQPIIHKDNTTEFIVKDEYDESYTNYNFNIEKIDKKLLLKSFILICPIQGVAVETISNMDKKVYYDDNLKKLYIVKQLELDILFNELIREIVIIKLFEKKDFQNIEFKSSCITYMLLNYFEIEALYTDIIIPSEYKELSSYDFRKELEKIRLEYESILTQLNDIILTKSNDNIER